MDAMVLPRRLLFLATAVALAACGPSAPATAPAAAPSTATATAPATPRIVSTVPAATLNLVLIGGDRYLVGVSTYDRLFLPADKQNLPVVGDYENLNFEELVKLQPTVLIVQQADDRISSRLKDFVATRHIELVNLRFDRVADIWTSARALGKAAHCEAETELAITRARRDLDDVAVDYKNAEHPTVLYIMDPALNLACGTHTFVDEMITLAGGKTAPVGDGFPTVGRETMVKLAPDVLLIGAPDSVEETTNDPRLTPWMSLPVPATRSKRVFLVTDGNSQMPSLNIGKNVRALAELIHRNAPAAVPPAGGAAQTGGEGAEPK
jgi:iron complex transport system substrate-binding protein